MKELKVSSKNACNDKTIDWGKTVVSILKNICIKTKLIFPNIPYK